MDNNKKLTPEEITARAQQHWDEHMYNGTNEECAKWFYEDGFAHAQDRAAQEISEKDAKYEELRGHAEKCLEGVKERDRALSEKEVLLKEANELLILINKAPNVCGGVADKVKIYVTKITTGTEAGTDGKYEL